MEKKKTIAFKKIIFISLLISVIGIVCLYGIIESKSRSLDWDSHKILNDKIEENYKNKDKLRKLLFKQINNYNERQDMLDMLMNEYEIRRKNEEKTGIVIKDLRESLKIQTNIDGDPKSKIPDTDHLYISPAFGGNGGAFHKFAPPVFGKNGLISSSKTSDTESYICGFHGHSGSYLDAVGPYWCKVGKKNPVYKAPQRGGTGGAGFSWLCPVNERGVRGCVTKVMIRHGGWIDALQARCFSPGAVSHWSPKWGGNGGGPTWWYPISGGCFAQFSGRFGRFSDKLIFGAVEGQDVGMYSYS